MEKHSDLLMLTEQEKDKLIVTLYDVIESLHLQINQQVEEIEKLKEQLKKNYSFPCSRVGMQMEVHASRGMDSHAGAWEPEK